MRIFLVGVLGVVALAGCGIPGGAMEGSTTLGSAPAAEGSPTPVDTQPAIDEQAATDFDLYTHCGINGTMIAGRWWQADPPLSDGHGNPPTGWGNPSQPGTLRMVDQETAVFSADQSFAGGAPLPSVTLRRTASTDYPFLCK